MNEIYSLEFFLTKKSGFEERKNFLKKGDYLSRVKLTRPFKILSDEEKVKKNLQQFYSTKFPIFFELGSYENLNKSSYEVPIFSYNLTLLGEGMEKSISKEVSFIEKTESVLRHFAKIPREVSLEGKIYDYLRYISAIKEDKVIFEYDLFSKKFINC